MSNREFVSVQEASAILGVATSTIYGWAKNGKVTIIPPQPPRIKREIVERIAEERKEVRA